MAALKRGIFKLMALVSLALISTSYGRIFDSAGSKRTSSKVRASSMPVSSSINPLLLIEPP
jgi:hypothetical protein